VITHSELVDITGSPCIEARSTFNTVFVTETDEKALGTIDIGATRSIAEQADGYKTRESP